MNPAFVVLDTALIASTLIGLSCRDRIARILASVTGLSAYLAVVTLIPMDQFQSMFLAAFLAFVFVNMSIGGFWRTNKPITIGLICMFIPSDIRFFMLDQMPMINSLIMLVLFSVVQIKLASPLINKFVNRKAETHVS